MIQLVNKQIQKLIFGKKNSIKKEKNKNIRIVWKESNNIIMSHEKKKTWTGDKVSEKSARYKVEKILI